MTVAAFGFGFLASAGTPALAQSEPPVLMTGGKAGDYYRFFAPPIVKVLEKAWVDATIAESKGTPESMDYILTNQKSYMLGQGNVVAAKLKDPKYEGKLRILPTSGLGNEAILAVMNDKTFIRSSGSWGVVASHAKQVRFVTASERSGPGDTFKQLQALDPNGLGKADVRFMPSMDEAIKAVIDGTADVALMVQFGNPENPRFQTINTAKLHFVPVINGSMKGIDIPGVGPAYTLCEGVEVAKGVALNTACTPILVLTGATNDNPDLDKAFKSVTPTDFMPRDVGFAALWKKTRTLGANAWASAMTTADEVAAKAASKM